MTLPEWEWEQDVLQNISSYIGVDLRYVLGIPKSPLTGDRLLYLLRGGRSTSDKIKEKVAVEWAMDEKLKEAPTHPHVVNLDSIALSGAPENLELRVGDLLGDLAFRRGQIDYLYSRHFYPSRDWSVRWALGAIFLAHRKILTYVDYRTRNVGIIFTEPFYVEHDDPEAQKRQNSRLLERLQGALTLKNRYAKRDTYQWTKIVNVASGPQYVSTMDKRGEIMVEEIPYPDA